MVHHLRKETAGDPLESVSGTAGITGSADTILVLKREPKDNLGLLYVRGRDVPEAEIAMQFDENTGKWLRLTGADDYRRSKERNAIIRALIDFGEPMTPAEIAAAIGKTRANSTVRVLLHKMHKAGDVVHGEPAMRRCPRCHRCRPLSAVAAPPLYPPHNTGNGATVLTRAHFILPAGQGRRFPVHASPDPTMRERIAGELKGSLAPVTRLNLRRGN